MRGRDISARRGERTGGYHSVVSPRLRKTVIGSLLSLGFFVMVGLVFIDEAERTWWFSVWIPIVVLGSAVIDYFVWSRPSVVRWRKERKRQREELRNRPRYGE